MMRSERNMATSGMMNANRLSDNIAPPKIAIAPTAVKLGGWGRSRVAAAIKIAVTINVNLGFFITSSVFRTKIEIIPSLIKACY